MAIKLNIDTWRWDNGEGSFIEGRKPTTGIKSRLMQAHTKSGKFDWPAYSQALLTWSITNWSGFCGADDSEWAFSPESRETFVSMLANNAADIFTECGNLMTSADYEDALPLT